MNSKNRQMISSLIILVLFAIACRFQVPSFLSQQATEISMPPILTEIAATLPVIQTIPAVIPTFPVPLPTGLFGEGQELRQWAIWAEASSEYDNPDWSAFMAIGPPDSPECVDSKTAWASATSAGKDWLQLNYATPVVPIEINIHQPYNPGQIVKVEILDLEGKATTVYEAEPKVLDQCPFVLSIPVSVQSLVMTVKIFVDQSESAWWNEIDAVELVGIIGFPGGIAPAP